jgi:RES domain-containing protein
MPTAWRLTEAAFAATAFNGEGSVFSRGRWHSPGTRIVYTSDSRALAVLEVLTRLRGRAPRVPYVLIGVTFPDRAVTRVDLQTLPDNWRAYPGMATLQALGDAWTTTRTSPVLQVPSAVIPEESNFLINPEHPDATRLTIGAVAPFRFDLRFFPQPE